MSIRITDRLNGSGQVHPGTAQDYRPVESPVRERQLQLGDSADSSCPTSPRGQARGLAGQVQVYDGGADGDADTAGDNTLFMEQGLFAP